MAGNDPDRRRSHPWLWIDERPFWGSTEPRRRQRGRHWFPQRSKSPNTIALQPEREAEHFENSQRAIPARQQDQADEPTPGQCYELPGHTQGTVSPWSKRKLKPTSLLTSSPPSSSDSPVELVTNEHGTYEEVREGFRAAAKEMAMARRQQQTLDQLASMQLDDEPGILRLRQPLVDAVAELGTDPPRPAELAGSSFHNDGGPTASGACRSSSSPPSAALEEESAVTTTPPKVPLKCSDRRISAPNMPWAHDDPSTSQRDRLTTLNDTRSRSYIYPSTSNPQEPQPRDNQNRHSTSILAGAHNSSPALTSPAAIPPRSSTTDTEKEPAGYSCFDELDRLVKQLPPRTPRRHLHPDVI